MLVTACKLVGSEAGLLGLDLRVEWQRACAGLGALENHRIDHFARPTRRLTAQLVNAFEKQRIQSIAWPLAMPDQS